MRATQPGELIQIDHMTVRLPGNTEIKEFKAICPVSKQMVVRAYPEPAHPLDSQLKDKYAY